MRLTLEQVRHVAALARLTLTPDEERRYQEQLSAVLEAMDTLRELDTEQVPPTSHATFQVTPLREDEVRPSLGTDRALANAPSRTGNHFAVPKILE